MEGEEVQIDENREKFQSFGDSAREGRMMRSETEIVIEIRKLMALRNQMGFHDERRKAVQLRLNLLLWVLGVIDIGPAQTVERKT